MYDPPQLVRVGIDVARVVAVPGLQDVDGLPPFDTGNRFSPKAICLRPIAVLLVQRATRESTSGW
ncbi:MAG: hypothetical protein CYG59_14605 [Chloroflexi bacterium]|nr:MAG: hypothetical protein CYG59_14605 [Chloroflexota bacterium]